MNPNTTIFLGAGASKAEGAPLQNELFRDYFMSPSFRNNADEMNSELATFFLLMFGINVDQPDLTKVEFPTFEEVLGLTDLAIMRKEAFRNFDLENRATNSGRLRFIAQYLVFLMAKLLDDKLKSNNGNHNSLVSILHDKDALKSVAFISTNYDILIDNAITELHDRDIDLDYAIEFKNFNRPNDWRPPRSDKSVFLFKPHGSLNWLFCPTCNSIEITPKEKGVVTKLISDFRDATCKDCDSVYMPLIVPPSFHKDLSNVFLSTIWNKAENILRATNHIVFCGYSFPDADIHIKYLLKRIQVNRDRELRFTVINHFLRKPDVVCRDEEKRFKRFLGSNVDYLKVSFEDFCAKPLHFINP